MLDACNWGSIIITFGYRLYEFNWTVRDRRPLVIGSAGCGSLVIFIDEARCIEKDKLMVADGGFIVEWAKDRMIISSNFVGQSMRYTHSISLSVNNYI